MNLLTHKPNYHIIKILRSVPFPGHDATWVIKLAKVPFWRAPFKPKVINTLHSRTFFEEQFLSEHREGCFLYVTLPKAKHPWAEINPDNGPMLDMLFTLCGPIHSPKIAKLIPQLKGKQFAICEQTYWAQTEDPKIIQREGLQIVASHMLRSGLVFKSLQEQADKALAKALKGS